MVAPEHDALRGGVLLEQESPEAAPELLGESRRQLVRDEPADVVLAKDVHRDGHDRSAPKKRGMYAPSGERTTGGRRTGSEEQRDRRHLTGRRSRGWSRGWRCSCRGRCAASPLPQWAVAL